jgi:hypothetical protein
LGLLLVMLAQAAHYIGKVGLLRVMEVLIQLLFIVWICMNMTAASDGLPPGVIVDSPDHLTGATIPEIVGKRTLNHLIFFEDYRFLDGQTEVVLQRNLGFQSQR